MLAGTQRVEIRDAVNAQDHRLAIDYELLDAVFESGYHDPWISLGPVMALAGEQPDAITVADYDQAVIVIFNLMKPIWTGWNCGFKGRAARKYFRNMPVSEKKTAPAGGRGRKVSMRRPRRDGRRRY